MSLDEKMDVVLAQLGVIGSRVTEISETVKSLDGKLNNLEARVESVEAAQGNSAKEIESTKVEILAEVNKARDDLHELQQKALDCEFVMFGLPPAVTDEQALQVILNFGDIIDEKIDEEDVKRVKALPNNKKKSSMIVGTFRSSAMKQKVMRKYQKYEEPVLVDDLLIDLEATSPWRGREVNLKNQLTPYYRKILTEAHRLNDTLDTSQKFKFIWEKEGKILIKKAEKSQFVHLKSIEQLNDIFSRLRNE